MADEVAGMPQSMLREVVLRLIVPEREPGINAISDLDYREQMATAPLRTAGAERLVRSAEAIDFLNRFGAEVPLLDELAGMFFEVIERPSKIGQLLNPYFAPTLVFEEILYAYRLVMLGASEATMERCLEHLVKGGWHREAEAVAERLGRQLTRDEVLYMVRTYTEGASQSAPSDKFWPEFARKYLGDEGYRLAQEWVEARNRRWANDFF